MRPVLFLTIIIGLIGSFWLNQPERVVANTPPPPAGCDLEGIDLTTPNTWLAVWDFETTNGCFVQVGSSLIPNQDPQILSMTTIACNNSGTVDFTPVGYAKFSGNGYLSCVLDLPNDLNQTYSHFWIYAQAQFNSIGTHSLFYHPDARLSVQTNSGNFGNLQWQYRHTNDLLESNMIRRFSLTADNRLSAAQCDSSLEKCPVTGESPYYGYATIQGESHFADSSQTMVQFRTDSVTLLIGYNPETGNYLNGKLGTLIVDPYGKDPEPTIIDPEPTPTPAPIPQ